MNEKLASILNEAIQDEYKARALYRKVIEKFGEVRPFCNIVEAENRHIQALLPLFERYGLPVPPDEWASKLEAPSTLLDACRQGVEAEIENMAMYTRLLEQSEGFPEVQMVLRELQRASKENHLPAFQRCVERGGTPGRGGGRSGPRRK
ncbi:MAG: hypothetical protein AXA67_10535 [Methylothermaceae bacteria B42]|nr:MAG: hypothetical protein AXA67_10535 [Methylothermaceae bacteria B42]HHJ38912.1 DUF2202 domain-containing protein [Methylothermaceae bacterium]